MTESETDPGVDRAQIEAALADPAFVSLRQSGAPVLVVASDPARVVFASGEARRLFAGDLAALTRRLLHGGEPGASRIVALSRALLPGAAPRLERLRFFFGPVAETVTVLCRRVAQPDGAPLFALAVLGMRAPAPPEDKSAIDGHFESASDRETHAAHDHDHDQSAPVALAEPAETPVAAPQMQRAVRFSWRTNGDHVVTALAPALAATVGEANADLVGRSFIDFAREKRLDPDGRLIAALAARDTWSGVTVSWPVDEGPSRALVTLGAAPTFDVENRFEGFLGFGLVYPERAPIEPAATDEPHIERAEGAAISALTEVSAVDVLAHECTSLVAAPETAPRLSHEKQIDPHPAKTGDADVVAIDHPAPEASPEHAEFGGRDKQMADVQKASETEVKHCAESSREPQAESGLDEVVAERDWAESIYAYEYAPQADPSTAQNEPLQDEQIEDRRHEPAPETPTETHDEDDEPVEVETPAPPRTGTVVPLRPQMTQRPSVEPTGQGASTRLPAQELSPVEKSAFEEIARALAAATPPAPQRADNLSPAANKRARDLIDLVARFGRSQEAPQTPGPSPARDFARESAPVSVQTREETSEDAPAALSLPLPVADTPPVAPRDALGRNVAAMIDHMPVGIVVSRFNVTLYANRTLLDLLDYADVDAFHAAGGLDRLFHGRTPDSGATRVETRDGELLPVDARVQAIEWDDAPATLVSLRRAQEPVDAARLKALELDLRQRDSEARELHAILDTATDGVAVLDAEGRILSLNRSAEALFGYDQNEVAGEHVSTLVARESQDAVEDYFEGLKSGGVASVLNDGREIIGRARQGGVIPVFMTLGRLGGTIPKFCAVLRDLTSWKKVEHELGDARRDAERASALKSDFLAKVSHEIRTPLNAILGFAEVIMDERFGPVGNERYRDYMRDIHKSGEHVLSLVNDLLDLSKIEAGKVDLTFTSVDANAIVSECVSIMQPQASRERVVMRLSLAPNLPNIVADERSLRQIVLNLLSNAIKFNEAGGQVIVSTALTDAGHAVVRIKDTGVGMSNSELETALEPFRQIATARKREGTGLGLPLTKALVEANRASFTIKSRKAEGTLVEVVFPPTRVLAE